MDSGNSGSLQSSSGGDANTVAGVSAADDQVYDSRQESLFLNPSMHFNHLLPPSSSSSSTFFDPTSYSQPINQNPNPNPNLNTNPMYNLESLWARNTNPNPNPNQNPIYNHQDPIFNPNPNPNPNHNPNPVGDKINPDTGPEKGKNPKKRTRASRRAPTTVLTTDTNNFRQMVQEFTGIPASPFSTAASSSFSRRLDLSPVQRIQLQQPSYLNSVNATSSNFHLPTQEIQGFTKQPFNLSNLSNLSNMQNQMFSFQPGSQTNLSHRENQQSEHTNESSKRWRGENEHLMNFEGGNSNIRNNQNAGVSSRSDDHNLQGNEDSWICPSD